jgi:hypothetical protein
MGFNVAAVCQTMVQAMSEMIFNHGFVHCDPHPYVTLLISLEYCFHFLIEFSVLSFFTVAIYWFARIRKIRLSIKYTFVNL